MSKASCKFCKSMMDILSNYDLKQDCVLVKDIESDPNCDDIQEYLALITGRLTVPYFFVDGKYIGGHNRLLELHKENQLKHILPNENALVCPPATDHEVSTGEAISLDSSFTDSGNTIKPGTTSSENIKERTNSLTSRKPLKDIRKAILQFQNRNSKLVTLPMHSQSRNNALRPLLARLQGFRMNSIKNIITSQTWMT